MICIILKNISVNLTLRHDAMTSLWPLSMASRVWTLEATEGGFLLGSQCYCMLIPDETTWIKIPPPLLLAPLKISFFNWKWMNEASEKTYQWTSLILWWVWLDLKKIKCLTMIWLKWNYFLSILAGVVWKECACPPSEWRRFSRRAVYSGREKNVEFIDSFLKFLLSFLIDRVHLSPSTFVISTRIQNHFTVWDFGVRFRRSISINTAMFWTYSLNLPLQYEIVILLISRKCSF